MLRYSWARDEAERDAWTSFARGMEGMTLREVRYYDLDYRRPELAPDHSGPRVIEAEPEWEEPFWRFPGGHTVDFGVELVGRSGQVWSVTWIPPGPIEGLALDDRPMFAEVMSPDRSVAISDVSARSEWQSLVGEQIEAVHVSYERWERSGAWWCPRIELAFRHTTVEFIEAQGNQDGSVGPSADNIVVRFRER